MRSCIAKEAARGGGGWDGGKGKGLRNAEPLRGLKKFRKFKSRSRLLFHRTCGDAADYVFRE